MRDVAPDGSPVPLYLAIPGTEEAELIHGAIPTGSAILELGCGVGRVSRELVRMGHAVTGVDNSTAMLAEIGPDRGVETVLADIAGLDLSPRRWPVVVLASRMVNDEHREAFLAATTRHVEPGGCVLVERHEPGWIDTVEPSSAIRHGIRMEIRDLSRPVPGVLVATMVYDVGDERFEQTFTAYDVDDDQLASLAETVGLRVDAVVDDRGAWVRLTPA
jgi:SAM-dependent methyltransferase